MSPLSPPPRLCFFHKCQFKRAWAQPYAVRWVRSGACELRPPRTTRPCFQRSNTSSSTEKRQEVLSPRSRRPRTAPGPPGPAGGGLNACLRGSEGDARQGKAGERWGARQGAGSQRARRSGGACSCFRSCHASMPQHAARELHGPAGAVQSPQGSMSPPCVCPAAQAVPRAAPLGALGSGLLLPLDCPGCVKCGLTWGWVNSGKALGAFD